MKENNTDNKPGTKQVPNDISQTSTKKFKLKFTDYAIEKYTSSFGVPSKYRVYTPFDVSKHTILKGLKLCQFFKTKKKFFVLRYWFNNQYKSKRYIHQKRADFEKIKA